MREGSRKLSPAFYAVTMFMAALVVLCVIFSLSWVNRPFAGFLAYDPPYVGSMSLDDWQGSKAGLAFLERILSVDGRPVTEGRDVTEAVLEKALGTPVTYGLESGEGVREVTLPVSNFGPGDYFLTFVITLVGGCIIFGIGIVVYVLKPGAPTSWVFLLYCLFLGTYMVSSFEILSSYHLVTVHYTALSFMGTALFHLGLLFPERKRLLVRWPWTQYLLYLPSTILAVLYQVYFLNFPLILGGESLSWMPSYKTLGILARVIVLGGVLGMVVSVVVSLLRASEVIARQRARIILLGVTFAFLPCAGLQMGYFIFRFSFPWNFLVFFIIIFPAAIAYSIARHNLFDADTIIKRTVGYVIVTMIVVGAYALVSVTFNVFMGQYEVARSRAFPILFTLGVILVFNPLRNRVQAVVDKVFFRAEYDYGAVLDKVGQAMTSLLDLTEILKRLTKTFTDDMFLDAGSVMLLSPVDSGYSVALAVGEGGRAVGKVALNRDDPLVKIIEENKRELTKYDVLEDPRYRDVSERCASNFNALHASLIVPLVYQDRVIGSLNLGEKKSGKSFNREDVDLLRTIASQGAVAIENARLFRENLDKQRMEEELSIARDLQMSMLPASCPQIEGFEIAAFSIPAKEVGGDFYDFIEMRDGKLGMVVADVTGKGVSGALVMSASRSIFRMLSDEGLSIGDLMGKANGRTRTDTTSDMFVALLYAVLDPRGRSLRLCSAGQAQPVHFSAATGETRLVETEGDTFPLGIIEEVDYEETRLQLAPGDKLVLYTDGIVEAMNEKEEMFGFDRLLGIVENARTPGAEGLMKEIMDSVNKFAGAAPQHDDLTVIVLQVAG